MRHQAAIHSNPPVTMPTRYPSPARPTTCSAEIFEASSDMPINGHRRSRPARKYSASVCFLPAARSTAPTTSARLMTIMAESKMPNTRRTLLPGSSVRWSYNSIHSTRLPLLEIPSGLRCWNEPGYGCLRCDGSTPVKEELQHQTSSTIHAGAWSLAFSSLRTNRFTPPS